MLRVFKCITCLLVVVSVLILTCENGNAGDKVLLQTSKDINIDKEFPQTVIRLNTQAYEIAESVINQEHLASEFTIDTELGESYQHYLTPLMPLALATCETGLWNNSEYTWSPFVYSKLLCDKVDMSQLNIEDVNEYYYVVNDLSYYLSFDANDYTSLGSLQILRDYVDEPIKWKCGTSTYDLMSWEDNVAYVFHKQSSSFTKNNHWNKEHKLSNQYELMALIAVGHNTGQGYQVTSSGSNSGFSSWNSAQSIYNYCVHITNKDSMRIIDSFVDEWYLSARESGDYSLPGNVSNTNVRFAKLLDDLGVVKSQYASNWGGKQMYPLKAVVNYVALEKLYTSGE